MAFIPGESLLAAACEADPTLQDHALAKRHRAGHAEHAGRRAADHRAVVAAGDAWPRTPAQVQQLGAELYERLRTMTGHMQSLQRSLTSSVEAYNKAVGSLESRVLVSARKFPGLGVVGSESAEIAELSPIEAAPRHLQAVEMLSDEDDEVGIEPTIVALPEGGGARAPARLAG